MYSFVRLFTIFYLNWKFLIFLRNGCNYKTVENLNIFWETPMYEKKIRIQQENLYKINFPATQLYCTLSAYVTTKTTKYMSSM